MTVGRINKIDKPDALYAVGRLNTRFNSTETNRAPRAENTAVSPNNSIPANRAAGYANGVIFSPDGDSAEISYYAANLSRSMHGGNSFLQNQDQNKPGLPIIGVDFRVEVPSPIIQWGAERNEPESFSAFRGMPSTASPPPSGTIPFGISPPTTASPNAPSSGNRAAGNENAASALDALEPQGACETCASRKYVDKSDDPSVSFQTPTSVNPNMAAAVVASHEQEHVRNEHAKAQREDREIVSQSVTLTYDTCSECGKTYVSGGTTRTMSIDRGEPQNEFAEEPE